MEFKTIGQVTTEIMRLKKLRAEMIENIKRDRAETTKLLPEWVKGIKSKRIAAGMTLQELADILGITDRQCMCNYENGKKKFPEKHIKKAAEVLNYPFPTISK